MPVTYFESPSIPVTYEQLTSWAEYEANSQGVSINKLLSYVNDMYPDADLTDFMIDETGRYLDYVSNGDGTYTVLGAYRDIQNTVQTNPIDSNASQISRGTIRQAINDGIENVGGVIKRHMTTFPASGSFANKAAYVLGSVGSAIGAVSTGIALGKVIDSTLYNANPDFWNSIGMSTLNPETWNSITNGDDSPFAGLFNLILGLDPETGKAQAYLDENAFAYLAWVMKEYGLFSSAGTSVITPEYISSGRYTANNCLKLRDAFSYLLSYFGNFYSESVRTNFNNLLSTYGDYYCILIDNMIETPRPVQVGGFVVSFYVTNSISFPNDIVVTGTSFSCKRLSIAVNTGYQQFPSQWVISNAVDNGNYTSTVYFIGVSESTQSLGVEKDICGFDATVQQITPVEGITNQDGATLPDVSNWTDMPSTIQSLQNQYPDLWNDAIAFDNIQPDGTVNRNTYVPVPLPDYQYNNDTQPVSSTLTQTDTQIDPETLTKTLLQIIANTVTATETQTETEPVTPPPSNPTDTGEGSSPVPTPPTGSASALWSVYHPTQAQINSFGSWLWSTNFVDQILKVFQNPMDAVISLHKVFINPVDAGTSTIVAGYLDSQVPSAYVTQQYVYKDCGSVDCHEYFGSVFDYVGTNVSLYLPFIGIVPLNVDEVMRSTINVKYGCDLFTGAILVEVKITRDGNDVVMYQYGGDGGVQYPISGSRSGGFLTGLAATIGAAASVATGGAMLPAAAAALGGSVMSAQKQVQHSGGFSGNSGAMGCKVPYLIIERPQTKVASLMPSLDGYPTNHAIKLSECSGQVVVSSVHVEGVRATKGELVEIENLLKAGVLV